MVNYRNFKRPPLPSIHMISGKYENRKQKFDFLKRNSHRKVIHDKEVKKRPAEDVDPS